MNETDSPKAETQEGRGSSKEREENERKTREAAKKRFPCEKWENAVSIEFLHKGRDFELPGGIDGIKVARSLLTGLKNDERTLAKEIRQAKILTDIGSSVYLLPKLVDADRRHSSGPDALVNGVFFEFKNIVGALERVEKQFRASRTQSENVFLKIDNPNISRIDVMARIRRTLRSRDYTSGTTGTLAFHISQTGKTYFMRIEELK